ncbi:RidA family protein [Sporosarcina sp. FA9]|uniref:RidA family protein n=1 Tax=Sporosarcina sp. FA9 TaxID=3413030 RepID=UPI003F656476
MSESLNSFHRIRIPDKIAEPGGHYTDGVVFGDMLWVSGMVSVDIDGNVVSQGDIVGQTEQVFQNIKFVLENAGATFKDIVKVTIYLCDINDREAVNTVRKKYFGEYKSASTLVEISQLVNPDLLVEIEAVAYLGNK